MTLPANVRELTEAVGSGSAILFTGAGFSASARDASGATLPDSAIMREELWRIVFGDDEPDASSLQDLYDVALERAPDALARYLRDRLSIGQHALPAHYATWFSLPWRRIYTLNVDDLELAVARQMTLRRPLHIHSALGEPAGPPPDGALEIVHLNGRTEDGIHGLTFSTLQYAARLCRRDRAYETFARDLETAPFVFAGTTLDEVVLWQHVELHRQRTGDRPHAKHSFLISPSCTRARQVLLESVGISWVQSTIEDIAEILAPLVAPASHR